MAITGEFTAEVYEAIDGSKTLRSALGIPKDAILSYDSMESYIRNKYSLLQQFNSADYADFGDNYVQKANDIWGWITGVDGGSGVELKIEDNSSDEFKSGFKLPLITDVKTFSGFTGSNQLPLVTWSSHNYESRRLGSYRYGSGTKGYKLDNTAPPPGNYYYGSDTSHSDIDHGETNNALPTEGSEYYLQVAPNITHWEGKVIQIELSQENIDKLSNYTYDEIDELAMYMPNEMSAEEAVGLYEQVVDYFHAIPWKIWLLWDYGSLDLNLDPLVTHKIMPSTIFDKLRSKLVFCGNLIFNELAGFDHRSLTLLQRGISHSINNNGSDIRLLYKYLSSTNATDSIGWGPWNIFIDCKGLGEQGIDWFGCIFEGSSCYDVEREVTDFSDFYTNLYRLTYTSLNPKTGCESEVLNTPDSFDFKSQSSLPLGTPTTTNTETISGFTGSLYVQILGGENVQVIKNGEVSESAVSVVDGDTLAIISDSPEETDQSSAISVKIGSTKSLFQFSTADNTTPLVENPIENIEISIEDDIDIDFSNVFTDPDGHELTYSVTGLPTGLYRSGTSIKGSVGLGDDRSYSVKLFAKDPNGASAVDSFKLNVYPTLGSNISLSIIEDNTTNIEIAAEQIEDVSAVLSKMIEIRLAGDLTDNQITSFNAELINLYNNI